MINVDFALIDVDALLVVTEGVTGRTLAIVATLTVLAGLIGTALVNILGALVDVYALAAVYGIQNVTVSTKPPRDASEII